MLFPVYGKVAMLESSEEAWLHLPFPLAINLRQAWRDGRGTDVIGKEQSSNMARDLDVREGVSRRDIVSTMN